MIQITNTLDDKKVNAKNIQFLIDIKSYVEISEQILKNNPFQRKRVKKSGSIYSLLKEDIKNGCIIPPIVLASSTKDQQHQEKLDPEGYLTKSLNDYENIKILDGLQRTYSIIEVYNENTEYFDQLNEKYLIRVELYLSISDTGILYRMLTLNTGQTQMTLRHQLEILYSRYLDASIGEINIIKETDNDSIKTINDFNFSDLIDGYNSFLEKNELPIDRFDILQNVKTIKFMSEEQENNMEFIEFIKLYHSMTSRFQGFIANWTYPDDVDEQFQTTSNPFGKNLTKIFNRSQPITGFGAAISELIESESISNFNDANDIIEKLTIEEDDLLLLNKHLDDVKDRAKKIGNGQRIFFRLFFKNLFDKEGRSFMNIKESLDNAKKRAMAEV
ncbi:hypothetical protein EMM73_01315 [Rheinheimera sediminis]|uniref:hypothetical protein n=1 Tax=Rheinheimera sp. YQF-1 TaxID=2499626 RepID=UPI000FD838B5|nr:hypothetical protein [Rheinheimera sp. YQF-1]RVT48611.1 hypothetical protein EMM73_01315 [Rheinheimera sp. YQF-1]